MGSFVIVSGVDVVTLLVA